MKKSRTLEESQDRLTIAMAGLAANLARLQESQARLIENQARLRALSARLARSIEKVKAV